MSPNESPGQFPQAKSVTSKIAARWLPDWERDNHVGLFDPRIKIINKSSIEEIPKKRVRIIPGEGGEKDRQTLILPPGYASTVGDLLRASSLLNPEIANDSTTPFNTLSRNLQNGAVIFRDVLIQQGISDSEATILSMFTLGKNLEEVLRDDGEMSPVTQEDFANQQIQYPPEITTNAQKEQYKKEVMYYLLFGKGIVLPRNKKDAKTVNVAEHTLYQLLFTRWRERHIVQLEHLGIARDELTALQKHYKEENTPLQEEFETEYLDKLLEQFEGKPRLLLRLLRSSLKGGRAKLNIYEVAKIASSAQFELALSNRGMAYIEEALQMPLEIIEKLSPELAEALNKLHEDESTKNEALLFSDMEVVAKNMQQGFSSEEIINVLSCFISLYPHADTFSPKLAVEKRAFECALKAFVLARILEKFFPGRFLIAGLSTIGHAELVVADRNSLTTDAPRVWGINTNVDITKPIADASPPPAADLPIADAKTTPVKRNKGPIFDQTRVAELKNTFFFVEPLSDERWVAIMRKLNLNPGGVQYFPAHEGANRNSFSLGDWKRVIKASLLYNVSTLPTLSTYSNSNMTVLSRIILQLNPYHYADWNRLYLDSGISVYVNPIQRAFPLLLKHPELLLHFARVNALAPDKTLHELYAAFLEPNILQRRLLLREKVRKCGGMHNMDDIDEVSLLGKTYTGFRNYPRNAAEIAEAIGAWERFLELYASEEDALRKRFHDLGAIRARIELRILKRRQKREEQKT